MASDSPDMRYVWAQLGLPEGAGLAEAQGILANAAAYRFASRERTEKIRHFVDFFIAREKFGGIGRSFEEIRAIYLQQAKKLHPDRNQNDDTAEDRLKAINAAYEIVDKIHKEARAYFRQDEAIRRAIEEEARQTVLREAGTSSRKNSSTQQGDQQQSRQERSRPSAQNSQERPAKYMAASVPRYIRVSRLPHLPKHAIIGSRFIKYSGGRAMVYDVIMLPEREFRRARLNLAIEGHGSPELTLTQLTPAYIPIDTKALSIPETEMDPYRFAKSYFTDVFKLTAGKG